MQPNQQQPTPSFPTPEPTPAPTPTPPAQPTTFGSATPVSTPEVPTAGGPVPPTTPTPSTPTNNGGKKKGLIIGIIAAAVLLVAGLGFAAYALLFNVTRDDYQQAYDQLREVRTDLSEVSRSIDVTGTEYEEAQTAYAAFKEKNEALGSLKAFRADADLRTAYEAYDAKSTEFVAFMDQFLPSMESFSQASEVISGVSSDDLNVASVEGSIAALENIGEVSDPTLQKFVESALTMYRSILEPTRIYENSQSSSERLDALSDISAALREYSSTTRELGDELEARFEAADPQDAFNALGEATTNKLNEQ